MTDIIFWVEEEVGSGGRLNGMNKKIRNMDCGQAGMMDP